MPSTDTYKCTRLYCIVSVCYGVVVVEQLVDLKCQDFKFSWSQLFSYERNGWKSCPYRNKNYGWNMSHRWCGSLSGFKIWLIVELKLSSLGQTSHTRDWSHLKLSWGHNLSQLDRKALTWVPLHHVKVKNSLLALLVVAKMLNSEYWMGNKNDCKIGIYYLHNLKTRQCLLVSDIDLSMVSWHCQVVGYRARIECSLQGHYQIQ